MFHRFHKNNPEVSMSDKMVPLTLTVSPAVKAWLDRKRKDGFVVSRIVANLIEKEMAKEGKKG